MEKLKGMPIAVWGTQLIWCLVGSQMPNSNSSALSLRFTQKSWISCEIIQCLFMTTRGVVFIQLCCWCELKGINYFSIVSWGNFEKIYILKENWQPNEKKPKIMPKCCLLLVLKFYMPNPLKNANSVCWHLNHQYGKPAYDKMGTSEKICDVRLGKN